jgi:hypothetical protein
MRTHRRVVLGILTVLGLVAAAIAVPLARTAAATPPSSNPKFSNIPLLLNNVGSSEPEISIGSSGTMAMVSLQWLFDPAAYGTHLWTGPFGIAPTHQGIVDNSLQQPGKQIFGAGDADVDIGATGALHISTLVFLQNPTNTSGQLGVSAITCPSVPTSGFAIPPCTAQLIGTTNADRQWVTSDGKHVYISFHDAADASLIDVQRSDDDGLTWQKVADPVVAQGGTTGQTTFNNIQGKLVADPFSHNVYDIYAAGETGVLKGTTFTPNNIIVSRSSDRGQSWTANVAFSAPAGTSLSAIFPALAVDPTNGTLYAVWSDGHTVSLASSTDQGTSWTPAVHVSSAPAATTAVLPWVAAFHGTVDVVYYGTTSSSNLDPSAQWNVFFAQPNGSGGFTQTQVNTGALSPNHVGVICTGGTACTSGTRNLLDLFQIAIDRQNGKAAIIYVNDTLQTSTDPNNFACLPNQAPPCPLPQAVLAQQG